MNSDIKVQTSSKNIFLQSYSISKEDRSKKLSQKPFILWFTGLSCSGKSTLANEIEKTLFKKNYKTYLLDGDNLRYGLNADLGFSKADREENIRRGSTSFKDIYRCWFDYNLCFYFTI